VIALALASLALLVYTYAGYPVLVALAAWLRPLRVAVDPEYLPSVTACVAMHDAAALVERKLASLLALDYPPEKLEVLFFDDGSTDDGAERVRARAQADHTGGRVRVLRSPERRGKPSALNALRAAARGEVLLMTDVRQPLASDALRQLVARLAPASVGCVSGNLVLEGAAAAGAYWRYEKWIRKSEGRFRGVVGVTGAIYVVRREDVGPLPEDLLLDDLWVPMQLRLAGRRILFCEDARAFDRAFDDQREFGRKVRTLAGNYQLFARRPRLLVPIKNPSWWETMSHKALRLVCPLALATLLSASALAAWRPISEAGPVATWSMRALFAGQLGGYIVAALGPAAGRLGGLARTFLVLHLAAVVALARFLRGGQRVTW
jgi:cellulose synthase/poly-beta-1,6-N-acetylglucosamine synthase-like glycosyltransferase